MGGRIAIPFDSIYHGTKFALEGVSESIQQPGAVGSNFWKNLKMVAKTSGPGNNSPYEHLANKMSEALKQMVKNTIHPSEVAKVILQAVTSTSPDFRYVVGKDAATILEARRNMSNREFQRLLKRQFNL